MPHKSSSRKKSTRSFNSLEVGPLEQKSIVLGSYLAKKLTKGFSVEYAPEPDPPDSVVTQITDTGSATESRFVLHIANFGDRVIVAKIKKL